MKMYQNGVCMTPGEEQQLGDVLKFTLGEL